VQQLNPYRAEFWLDEELDADQPAGTATSFAPRTVKDLIEEQLFARCQSVMTFVSQQHGGAITIDRETVMAVSSQSTDEEPILRR
jgi:hypothetical protein